VEDIFYWFIFSSQGASASGTSSRMFGGSAGGGEQGPSKGLLEGLGGKRQKVGTNCPHSHSLSLTLSFAWLNVSY
jgi:hypothetical protein